MKTPTLVLAVSAALVTGCVTSTPPKPEAPCAHAKAGGVKDTFHYVDHSRGFGLCLPPGLTKSGGTSASNTVTFTGFAVPTGTNLEAKTLVVSTGADDLLTGSQPSTSFQADGVTFRRVIVDDGSAGHSTMHVIYTLKSAGKSFHLDFTHRGVNPGNFDPPNQPKVYDRAGQIKITEEIMNSFRKVPKTH